MKVFLFKNSIDLSNWVMRSKGHLLFSNSYCDVLNHIIDNYIHK